LKKTSILNTGIVTIAIGLISSAFVLASENNEKHVRHFETDKRLEEKFDNKCQETREIINTFKEDITTIKNAVNSINEYLREKK